MDFCTSLVGQQVLMFNPQMSRGGVKWTPHRFFEPKI